MASRSPATPGALPAYPAIAACVSEGRGPSFGEIRRVIPRLRQEIGLQANADAATRRRISRAALVALGVL